MTEPAHPHDHSHAQGEHLLPSPTHHHTHEPPGFGTVLGWPAWLRVVTVLPVVVALWLAVLWTSEFITPW